MELTEEQQAVVAINAGSHLVLAPPGSGKTEMLSQRILCALKASVPPRRMLCATFTNRAAFEMRTRVVAEAENCELPDVGNLHHHCEVFLRKVGVLHHAKRVIDEVEQRDMAREVVNVLRSELVAGRPADLKETHGVTVLAHLKGQTEERLRILHEEFESYVARCEKDNRDLVGDLLAGVTVVHQQRIGIPRALRRPWPKDASVLFAIGLLDPLEKAYRGLKRRFLAVDFEDLLNETYLYLVHNPLPSDERFAWVQIDEVQDLNPLQWAIVRELSAADAVSVYFGDLEQAIFSFLGASLSQLSAATRTCQRHYFRKNFRATPLLLEVLMRYSLGTLKSEREFLAIPSDLARANGEMRMMVGDDVGTILHAVNGLLRSNRADCVAILVRTNREAEELDQPVRALGWRSVKVSGLELANFRPMRDFYAFVDLFAGCTSRSTWTMLVRRFGGVHSVITSRYFVRGMFAAGWEPMSLFSEENFIPLLPPVGRHTEMWAWRNRRTLLTLRRTLKPLYDVIQQRMSRGLTFREMFVQFASVALEEPPRYLVRELLPDAQVRIWRDARVTYAQACDRARERIEKFLRYTDHTYGKDRRSLLTILHEEWEEVRRLKEADLLVGDERIVISTIHKAKGRQFDAVVIPGIDAFNRDEESLRLLYVAMSRAKRHLLLFRAREQGEAPWIADCFRPDYTGYYQRKAAGENLQDDWLFQWERLASLNASGLCDMDVVTVGLASSFEPVARMAAKTLCHCSDGVERRRLLLSCLRQENGFKSPFDAVVESLGKVGCFDAEVIDAVRSGCWTTAQVCTWWAALHYYQMGLDRAPSFSSRLLLCLGDCIYASDGEVRRAAAELLDGLRGTELCRIVLGSPKDFERLALIPDPGHEETLRAILNAHALSGTFADDLRKILLRPS